MQKINGVQFPNGTYKHGTVVSEMSSTLYEAVRDNLMEELKKSPYFGVIVDESCDISNYKKIVIYFTYVNEKGLGSTAFVDILNADDGKADTILNAILETANKFDVPLEKIVGIGTDGAAVMTGCNGGVGIKLKECGAHYLTQIHCAAHRIALALSQAAKKVERVKQIEITLSQLFRFFDDSPVRETVLRKIHEINDTQEIKLKEPKQIRWLSLIEAVGAVIKSYAAIVQALEHIAAKNNDMNAVKAKGLLAKIKIPSFPCLLSIILDILEPIKKLSLIFQQQNVLFSKVQPMVMSCIDVIDELRFSKGKNEDDFENNCIESGGKFLYRGVVFNESYSADNIKEQFISAVLQNLKDRFPEQSLLTLRALDVILNPKSYPASKTDLSCYGNEELECLMAFYATGSSPLINSDIARGEFKHFKLLTFNYKDLTMQNYIQKLITEYHEDFSEFSKLAKIANVLPISSADAERGFSCMKLIKTVLRNRISEEKLNHLMMISLQGPELVDSQSLIEKANSIFCKNKNRVGGSNCT